MRAMASLTRLQSSSVTQRSRGQTVFTRSSFRVSIVYTSEPLSLAYSSASIPPARMDLANKEGFPRNNKRQRLGIHGIATHRISALDSISAGANHKEPTTKQVKPQPRWCSVTEIPKLHDYPKVICEVSDSQLKVCDVLPKSPQRVDVYVIANVRFIYTDTSTHSEIQR